MRHGNQGRKFNRTASHRKAMWGNMTAALIKHEQIKTTLPKAKEARRFAERCITIGKKALAETEPAKQLHYRRMAMQVLHNADAVKNLIEKVAPTYKERAGGYTRVLKAGFRLGDNGAKAIFELV